MVTESTPGDDHNACGDCGHVWLPRTRAVSLRCPSCGSREVSLYADSVPAISTFTYQDMATQRTGEASPIASALESVLGAVFGVGGCLLYGVTTLAMFGLMAWGGLWVIGLLGMGPLASDGNEVADYLNEAQPTFQRLLRESDRLETRIAVAASQLVAGQTEEDVFFTDVQKIVNDFDTAIEDVKVTFESLEAPAEANAFEAAAARMLDQLLEAVTQYHQCFREIEGLSSLARTPPPSCEQADGILMRANATRLDAADEWDRLVDQARN